ncbi:hypothetical protein ETD86_29435 [Nonomuraea turkmeniaca]|uniref:Uncharacterized protein n=1 Tax=Nonomuraea turkmeniaca TaxID=103838 RepID=A0A5S4FB76_9ACTN|nr:DUF6221 family protein [Nonomuraea turkmeniaca]TMR14071.1 hypothetical protein ETD86_29435 [Nonomuraea turkmeniaca]
MITGTEAEAVERLLLRLDEDEQAAAAAGGGEWVLGTDHQELFVAPTADGGGQAPPGDRVAEWTYAVNPGRPQEWLGCDVRGPAHVVRHHPARVLAEAAALRRILARHQPHRVVLANVDGDDREYIECAHDGDDWPCRDVLDLAGDGSDGNGGPPMVNPPGTVWLLLSESGPGSRAGIEEYVRDVIGQRTTPDDDITADRLARGLVYSILHRLGGYPAWKDPLDSAAPAGRPR